MDDKHFYYNCSDIDRNDVYPVEVTTCLVCLKNLAYTDYIDDLMIDAKKRLKELKRINKFNKDFESIVNESST